MVIKEDYKNKVEKLLDSRKIQRLRRHYPIEVINGEHGAIITILVHDDKRTDLLSLTTNEDGYIHPAQVLDQITIAWEVARSK